MNVILQLGSEYLLVGCLLLATLLFIAAAIGNWMNASNKQIFVSTRSTVTMLWVISNDDDAKYILNKNPPRQSRGRDDVFICWNVHGGLVKRLRLKYQDKRVTVYSPRVHVDVGKVLLQAYKKSKKGELVIALPSRYELSEVSIKRVLGHMRTNTALCIVMQNTAQLGLMRLLSNYIEIIQRLARYSGLILGDRTQDRQLGYVYHRDNFAGKKQKVRLDWIYLPYVNGVKFRSTSTREVIILASLAFMYGLLGILAAVVSASTHQIGVLGIVWGLTIAWVVVASFGSRINGKKWDAVFALPLMPFLLFAYIVVYPIAFVANRLKTRLAYA